MGSRTTFQSSLDKLSKHLTAGRGADQKNGQQPEGAARSNLTMLHKPNAPDQQGVRDFVTEGPCSLTAVEMNRVLQNCGYEHQRHVSDRHVDILADLMRRGRWQPKSQIDFAVLGGRYILINGYHRAYAQVRSGKSILWSIALHKCTTDADLRSLYYAFDTNIRTRGTRDILVASEFGEAYGVTGEMAASLYAAVPFIASRFSMSPNDRNHLVTKQVDRRLEVAAEYAKAAGRYSACFSDLPAHRKQRFKAGGMTAVAVVTFRYQSETAWQFWSGVMANDGLKRGDPRLALVTDLMTRKVRSQTYEVIAPAIIAWNAFFNDRQLQQIKVLDSFVPVIDGTPFDGKSAKKAG